ncbi:hypothetical protein SAMN04488523_10810 [Sulfitobacter brevis]|uniref:Uncharacterized protein n=1 Tax=Sulfitobacter brevis TaxID=74348 RepID=A0A1I2B9Q7_9RHOB|nr:hypothetical protein [Sulfitobacter brevis]SFE51880.1 hypothetical protein SAMN04488523_10810 [Sulfitobacter brevis]
MMDMMSGPMMAAMMGIGGVLLLLVIAVLVLSVLALVKFLRRPS